MGGEGVQIAVLSQQLTEIGRRVQEVRADVRSELAETREAIKDCVDRMEGRYEGLNQRVRAVEVEQGKAKERLSTWRAVIPLLSGLAAGVGSWSKELVHWLTGG